MFKRFAVLILMIICLMGCHGSKPMDGLNGHEESPIGYPNVTEYGNDGYFYLVDNNTGVVYLKYDGRYHCGLTVMTHKNGQPITIDELKKWYEEQ